MNNAAPTASAVLHEPSAEHLAIVDDPARLIALEGVHNFRDLGGYEISGGRTIGWGRLFRADGLYRLSDDDLDIIDALGVRTVIDLRSDPEIAKYGTFPVERLPVDFHSLSIIDTTWHDADLPDVSDDEQGEIDFLTWAYGDMLQAGGDRFAEAIQQLALPGSGPAVFHCAAGKDRTGVLAALMLGGLGVDRDVIVADYGLTRAGMDRMRTWVKSHHPEMATRMSETPSFMLAAHPQAMANVIDGLVSDHGSIRRYLSTIGVGTAVLDCLADTLTH
ncbi:MAG: tyrosine-protein phosphatase [Ilumatobacter sp.]